MFFSGGCGGRGKKMEDKSRRDEATVGFGEYTKCALKSYGIYFLNCILQHKSTL